MAASPGASSNEELGIGHHYLPSPRCFNGGHALHLHGTQMKLIDISKLELADGQTKMKTNKESARLLLLLLLLLLTLDGRGSIAIHGQKWADLATWRISIEIHGSCSHAHCSKAGRPSGDIKKHLGALVAQILGPVGVQPAACYGELVQILSQRNPETQHLRTGQ
eukprot:gene21471-28444_t